MMKMIANCVVQDNKIKKRKKEKPRYDGKVQISLQSSPFNHCFIKL